MVSEEKKSNTEQELLTPSQAAQILMISPITLRQWAQKGMLPAYTTVGGHRRFRLTDIENFARDNNSTIANKNNSDLRLLVIDDDENILRFLGHLFEEVSTKNVILETATNGFDGGLKIHSFKPDFLLLDLKMSGMDGFEVCQQVKQNSITADIRVLTMTGFPTRENTERIISLGAEACFAKPLDIKAVLSHMKLSI